MNVRPMRVTAFVIAVSAVAVFGTAFASPPCEYCSPNVFDPPHCAATTKSSGCKTAEEWDVYNLANPGAYCNEGIPVVGAPVWPTSGAERASCLPAPSGHLCNRFTPPWNQQQCRETGVPVQLSGCGENTWGFSCEVSLQNTGNSVTVNDCADALGDCEPAMGP